MAHPLNILFVCIANSIRSQMAEGLAKKLLAGNAVIQSAGAFPSQVHPFVIQVLNEIGIDISQQYSKSIESIDIQQIDLIIILCEKESCPDLPSTIKQLHWPMLDPLVAKKPLEQLALFRQLRDELKNKIAQILPSK